MRIAYWTIDEVNLSVARELAETNGATIDQVVWKDRSPQDADAILYDLDFSPPEMRDAALSALLASPPPCPVAVHSYNLVDSQVEMLERHGVAVHRSLDAQVLGGLCDAILQVRVATLDRCHGHRNTEESVDAAVVAAFNPG